MGDLAALLFSAVVALALPAGTTIDEQPARDPVRISQGGVIAATVTTTGAMQTQRIAIWSANGRARVVAPPSQLDPGELSAGLELAGFDGSGTLYATLVKSMELEAGGNESVPGLYPQERFVALSLAPCASVVQPDFRPYAETVDGGAVYLTYESPDSTEVLEGDSTSDLAPYAVRVEGSQCTLLARASLRGESGGYAIGFRGYLGAFNAPNDLDTGSQRYVAVRMHDGAVTEIGAGVALAVNATGDAVGADAPVDIHEDTCCTPHATLWQIDGTSLPLANVARSSVAYAIDAQGDVLGTLVGSDGKRYAFLWNGGHLHLLDETHAAAGWHFASAFAFGLRGAIVGAGTYRGQPSLFEITQ